MLCFVSEYIFGLDKNEDLIYQLDLCAKELCQLCAKWQSKLRPIPTDRDDYWGPSEDDLQKALELAYNLSLEDDSDTEREVSKDDESDSDSGEDWAGVEHEGSDGDLIESLEALAFSDLYRGHVAEEVFPHFSDLAVDKYRTSSTSPSKRPRGLSP